MNLASFFDPDINTMLIAAGLAWLIRIERRVIKLEVKHNG